MKQNEFYLKQLAPLKGGKIEGTVSDQEGEFYGLAVTDGEGNKAILWLLRDDEGNGPGSFEIQER